MDPPPGLGTLLAGLYAALSPIWISTTGERDAYWGLIVLAPCWP